MLVFREIFFFIEIRKKCFKKTNLSAKFKFIFTCIQRLFTCALSCYPPVIFIFLHGNLCYTDKKLKSKSWGIFIQFQVFEFEDIAQINCTSYYFDITEIFIRLFILRYFKNSSFWAWELWILFVKVRKSKFECSRAQLIDSLIFIVL